MLFTYTPCWKGQRGQKKRRGCSQHSSSSTAWCPCLRSTERYSLEGGWLTADPETHPDSTTTPSLPVKDSKTERRTEERRGCRRRGAPGGKTENDGKSILMKTNGQQQSNSSMFLPGSTAREMSPSCTELTDKESIQAHDEEGEVGRGRFLTLDRFGVLLDLTVGSAADHIPHYDLSRGISRGQPQTVRRAQVVVVVFPGPFHLANTKNKS